MTKSIESCVHEDISTVFYIDLSVLSGFRSLTGSHAQLPRAVISVARTVGFVDFSIVYSAPLRCTVPSILKSSAFARHGKGALGNFSLPSPSSCTYGKIGAGSLSHWKYHNRYPMGFKHISCYGL